MNEKNSSHKQRLAILLAMMFYSAAIIGFSLYLDRQISKLLSAHTVWVAAIGILAVIIGAGLFGWFSLQKWALRQGRDAFSGHAVKAAKLQLFGITLLIWGIAFCAGNTLTGWLLSMACCVLLIIQQWNRLKQISKFGESNWYSLPPGVGKTTLAIFFLTWLAGKIPDKPMLTGSHSNAFVRGVYLEIANEDGSVSFQDVTNYTGKEKSFFGAKDANRMNEALNTIMSMVENGTDLYTAFQAYFTTQKGLFENEAKATQNEFDAYVCGF